MKRAIALTVAVALAVLGVSAGSYAAVKTKKYTGLFVYSKDKKVGEIDRTTSRNNKVIKDTSSSSGDHMRIEIPFRDRAPKNGKGVHVSVDWKKYGKDCGISGIEVHVTGGGISKSCSTGWKGNGHFESWSVSGSGWAISKPRKYFNGEDLTLRGGVHICQTQWNSDPCSGRRWVTTFWD